MIFDFGATFLGEGGVISTIRIDATSEAPVVLGGLERSEGGEQEQGE